MVAWPPLLSVVCARPDACLLHIAVESIDSIVAAYFPLFLVTTFFELYFFAHSLTLQWEAGMDLMDWLMIEALLAATTHVVVALL